MTYGVSYPQLYYRAASFVATKSSSAKPADIPVEQPTKLELILNLKTAKALGLTIPPGVSSAPTRSWNRYVICLKMSC
jgi:putative ABC transport system substrate-binding protein